MKFRAVYLCSRVALFSYFYEKVYATTRALINFTRATSAPCTKTYTFKFKIIKFKNRRMSNL